MIKRRLGADGPEITAVGYGSMSFGAAYGPTTRENSVAILDAMQDLGLDHFDTAYIYAGGEAETIFGDYCRQSPAARDFFTVATKGGIFTGPAADNDGFANNNSREFLSEQLDTSLGRLGTDYVDLYLRWDRERTPIEEAMDTLAGFVKAGKIRSIGERSGAQHPAPGCGRAPGGGGAERVQSVDPPARAGHAPDLRSVGDGLCGIFPGGTWDADRSAGSGGSGSGRAVSRGQPPVPGA